MSAALLQLGEELGYYAGDPAHLTFPTWWVVLADAYATALTRCIVWKSSKRSQFWAPKRFNHK